MDGFLFNKSMLCTNTLCEFSYANVLNPIFKTQRATRCLKYPGMFDLPAYLQLLPITQTKTVEDLLMALRTAGYSKVKFGLQDKNASKKFFMTKTQKHVQAECLVCCRQRCAPSIHSRHEAASICPPSHSERNSAIYRDTSSGDLQKIFLIVEANTCYIASNCNRLYLEARLLLGVDELDVQKRTLLYLDYQCCKKWYRERYDESGIGILRDNGR